MKKQILLIEAIWLLFTLLTSYVCMGSVETIRNLEKEANIIEGPSVSGRNVPTAEESIKNWIEKHGLKK